MHLLLGLCHHLLNKFSLEMLRNLRKVCNNYLHAEVLYIPINDFSSTCGTARMNAALIAADFVLIMNT
jgi:hypothetical protein